MNRKVKRYDPINSDGTCGMCIEDADYGAYVEYADYAALEAELATVKKVAYGNMELLDENQKLKAELAKMHAGQESVGEVQLKTGGGISLLHVDLSQPLPPGTKLYTAPQASAVVTNMTVPDGWKLVPVEPTLEMLDAAIQDGICVDGKPVWKRDVVFQAKWRYQQMLSAAPSAPATVPSVNQQLLEALESMMRDTGLVSLMRPDQIERNTAAIAAARKGEGE